MTMKKSRSLPPKIRTAVNTDAKRIHDLIEQHVQEGRLLPRELSELRAHVDRFVVAVDGRGAIVGCGELAPLSHSLAEIRSLVVTRTRRSAGVGGRIVSELRQRARRDGYDDLCVFAHQPAYFAHMGFSIVPHTWLPEKISANCRTCELFRQCGQYAMVADLDAVQDATAAEQPLHV
jgi:N-acetylglutamate synthase-like GNAT family acetyltransferase